MRKISHNQDTSEPKLSDVLKDVLFSDSPVHAQPTVRDAWNGEVQRRKAEYLLGRVQVVPAEIAFERVLSKYA